METDNLNNDCTPRSNLAVNPDITNELSLDSEIQSNTKSILESVCNDFENIDVLASKENKLVLKKWRPFGCFSEFYKDVSDFAHLATEENEECTSAEREFISNTASSETDSIHSAISDGSTFNSPITTAVVVSSLDSQNETSCDIVNSKNLRTEMTPLEDSSKVGILSDNFTNDKNISSSLAELADAEIVQTSENAVSIIISNPRFIQVLNCKDSGLPSDTSDITVDSNCIVSEKENLNEVIVDGTASASDFSLHDVCDTGKDSHTDVTNEIIYSGEEIYNFSSSMTNTLHSKEKNRPYFRSRADLGKVAATRARRITAKMKTEWSMILEEKGFLICPLSGCFQRYRTMANFMTHYKFCYSGMEKDLKHCPYCASVIFSSHKAVLHHMKVEHPEKLEEYKTNFPQPEDVYDCPEEENSRLVEISQKSLKDHTHNRKFNLTKENHLASKKRILKNKLKTMHEPVIENSKLRECGRFDEIVSKISSVSRAESSERDENKPTKERRKRKLILTGHLVTAEKYFEDERDSMCDGIFDIPMEKETEEKVKVNTKSRLVLNMDRYKRYTQYLTVTRDFGSHRRTYSRPKSSNVLDSSHQFSMHNDSSELDIHQLNRSLESSSISLNENDTLCLSDNNNRESDLCCVSPEISAFDPLQSEASILNRIHLDSTVKRNSVSYETKRQVENLKSNEHTKEKVPCYKSQISSVISPKIEMIPSRKQSLKISPIITYGKIPDSISALMKSDRPPTVDFDSLIKNSANKKLNPVANAHHLVIEKPHNTAYSKKLNSAGEKNMPHISGVEKSKYNKEDGIKHPPNSYIPSIAPVKRKRGRPRKETLIGRPLLCEKLEKTNYIFSGNLHVYKNSNLKSLKKQGDLKRVKEKKRDKKKSSSKKKKNKNITRNSNVGMSKMSSEMHSKLIQRRRMKISAKSSLKKAILCGVKGNNGQMCGKRPRGRPPRICVKSLLKNNKLVKKKEPKMSCEYLTPPSLGQNSNTDHNYFSSTLRICENEDSSLNNFFASERKEHSSENSGNTHNSLRSLKEVEFSEILPQEVIITSTEVEKEIILPITTSIESVRNVSILENQKNESSFIEKEHNVQNVQTSIQPIISSELDTVADLSALKNTPFTNDNVVSEKDSPTVITKRSRGRPRKSDTPQMTKKTDARTESPKIAIEKPLIDEFSSPSPYSGVRKSERVRKRKSSGAHYIGSDEVEKSDQIIVKTGRRGRPRKFAKLEICENKNCTSETKTDETNLCDKNTNPPTPLSLNHKEQKKVEALETPRGRRGRPPRQQSESIQTNKNDADVSKICVDTQHTHTPPPLSSLNESDDKNNMCEKEEESVKGDLNDSSHRESIDTEMVPINSDPSSLSKKKLILPLKKRKKVEDKLNCIPPSKKNNICDNSVEKKISEKKGVSDKRKGICSLTNKEENINISPLLSSSIEVENLSKDPNSSLLDKVKDQKMCADVCDEIYPTLKPDINTYKLVSNYAIWREYLESSISIKLTSCDWIKLKCFDSVLLNDSKSSAFFTGGPVQSTAFCPVPSHMNQYIAVATSDFIYTKMGQNSLSYTDANNIKGIIQIWNLGCLQSTKLNKVPSMELALEHDHGVISQMKWCPKGCYDFPVSSDGVVGSRLGLLALSCSDSVVRIYSLPQPNILPKMNGNAKFIYKTSPSLVLTPLFSPESCSFSRTIVTCLDWHQNAEVIAAGYGNGSICVWAVKKYILGGAPTATIVTMKNQDRSLSILPYLVFEASGTPVTGISFPPIDTCQYLVSSSFDKTLKFFDLNDTSMPFCSIKRGFALNDCKWAKDFCGSLVSLHDGINFKGSTFGMDCGTEEVPPQNILCPFGSLTCSAISDVTDVQAVAEITGSVSVNFFNNSCDELKQPDFDTFLLFETEVVTLNEDKKVYLDKVLNSEISSTLHDILDIVEVVMDEFPKCSEYNTVDNLLDTTSDINQVKEFSFCDPELRTVMDNLLESVCAVENTCEIAHTHVEEAPVMVSQEGKTFNRTNENKEMTVPPILTCGDLNEKRHFPIEEMLKNSVSIQQLLLLASNTKKFQISNQLNRPCLSSPDELISSHNFASDSSSEISADDISDVYPPNVVLKDSPNKKSIDLDCSDVLYNCVDSVCDIVHHRCVESKLELISEFQHSVEKSKPINNTIPMLSVESESGIMCLQQSNISKSSALLESSVGLEPAASESPVVLEPATSESTVVLEPATSESTVVLEPVISESSVVQQSAKLESQNVQQSVELEPEIMYESVELEGKAKSVESVNDVMQQSVESQSSSSHPFVDLEAELIESTCNNIQQSVESETAAHQSTKSELNIEIHKSIEPNGCALLQSKSGAGSLDIANHAEESNFSDDSFSMISECSYVSDSCDSVPSFLSDALAPVTPSESPILIDIKDAFLHTSHTPASVSNKITFSEPVSAENENCSSEALEGKYDFNIKSCAERVGTEKLECEMPVTILSTEVLDCSSNDGSNLNHSHSLDTSQMFDSSNKSKCLLDEQKFDSIVPNCLLSKNESDHMKIVNEESSPIKTNDSMYLSESNTVEERELASPDPSCKPQTSRQFLENGSSNGEAVSNVYNLKQRTKKLLLEESPISYTTLISKCGLIFKDVNANSTSSEEKKDSISVKSNILCNVNAISWNPNYGCHFWLVTAGNSGVARLICVSELNPQENTSLLDKESIM